MTKTSHLALLAFTLFTACSKKEGAEGKPEEKSVEKSAAEPEKAAEIPCVDDDNKRTNKGRVTKCKLAKEHTLDGYTCDAGKVASFHPDGSLKSCYLAEAKTVDGYACKDGTELYPGGKLERCKLEEGRTVGGIELKKGDWVTLYKGGSIQRVELAAGPRKLKDLTCKGYLNYFHENGELKKCQLDEDTKIDGKTVKAGTFVCFDEKGKAVDDCKALSWQM